MQSTRPDYVFFYLVTIPLVYYFLMKELGLPEPELEALQPHVIFSLLIIIPLAYFFVLFDNDEPPKFVPEPFWKKSEFSPTTTKDTTTDEGQSFRKHGLDENGNKFTIGKILRCIPSEARFVGVLGKYYDFERFLPRHPGGDVILEYAGKDATIPFLQYHETSVLKQVKDTGRTYELDLPKEDVAWMKLNEEFKKAGYFKRPLSYFIWKIVSLAFLACFAITMKYLGYFYIPAIAVGVMWRQSAFCVHYLEHNQIFESRKRNRFWGSILGTGVFGVNATWWRSEHNEHHLFTTTYVEGYGMTDPSFNVKQMVENETTAQWKLQSAITRLLLPFQHWIFFGILPFIGRIVLIKASWDSSKTEKFYKLDIICMWNHILYNYILYFYLFDSFASYLLFWFLAATIQGFLACQLLMSHITMPYETKTDAKKSSTLVRQAGCTLDIDTFHFMDIAWGGLNLHLVHHLFPRMHPQAGRPATERLKELLKELGVKYNCLGTTRAIIHVWKHLRHQAIKFEDLIPALVLA